MPRIKAPIIFVHSLEDTLVSPLHSRELYAASTSTSTLLEISGAHNDIRPIAVLKQVLDALESAVLPMEETAQLAAQVALPLKVKALIVRERSAHTRDRTRAQCGSYSEKAFRDALSELVNR